MKRLVCIIVLTAFVFGLAVPSSASSTSAVPSSDAPTQSEEVSEAVADLLVSGCLLFVVLIVVALCDLDVSDSRDTGSSSRHRRDHCR